MQPGKLRGYGFGSRLLKIAIREFRRISLAKERSPFSNKKIASWCDKLEDFDVPNKIQS
jgi:predicted GNAT family acetyltransferase